MYPAKYAEMTNQEYPHKLPDPLPTLKFWTDYLLLTNQIPFNVINFYKYKEQL
jgi:hypothetical protein